MTGLKESLTQHGGYSALSAKDFEEFLENNDDNNEEPVIGILTQTLEDFMHDDERFDGYKSYIMASYVKFMESSGARVVPIINEETFDQINDKINHVDGILFPGGDGDYNNTARMIF